MSPEGFYWAVCERSSARGVVQLYRGKIYCINEAGPIALEELERRGWKLGEFIGSDVA